MPRVISELICSDLDASLAFYGLLGFTIRYQRPEERFVYLTRDGAALMLEQPHTHDRLYPHREGTGPAVRPGDEPNQVKCDELRSFFLGFDLRIVDPELGRHDRRVRPATEPLEEVLPT